MNGNELANKMLEAGLDANTFSILTNTPIATVKNWLAKRNGVYGKCPGIAEAYINLYIDSKKNQIYIEKLVDELKKGIN